MKLLGGLSSKCEVAVAILGGSWTLKSYFNPFVLNAPFL